VQAWRDQKVLTHAGYILGFPADTPATIERDIKVLQDELPLDVIEFFVLTPLPGSADHQALAARGVPMSTDMNSYDTEHVTTAHSKMTAEEWMGIYQKAWHLYYSDAHVETMMRRAEVSGLGASKLLQAVLLYYGSIRFEKLHPLQCGVFRRKIRSTRRPSFARENPLVFYPKRLWEVLNTYVGLATYYLRMNTVRRAIKKDPLRKQYMDLSMTPVVEEEPLPVAAGESCDSCDSDHSHGDTPPITIVPLQLPPAKKKVA